jgi:hypothetical protein
MAPHAFYQSNQSFHQPLEFFMSNQHTIEDGPVVQPSAASHAAAAALSGTGERDEQSALLRALLVRGLSGAVSGIAYDSAK